MSKPSYSRVSDIHVLCSDCRVPRYLPLDSTKWYRIAVNDFAYNGGDGYTMFKKHSRNYRQGKRLYNIRVLCLGYTRGFQPYNEKKKKKKKQGVPGTLTYQLRKKLVCVGNFYIRNLYTITFQHTNQGK